MRIVLISKVSPMISRPNEIDLKLWHVHCFTYTLAKLGCHIPRRSIIFCCFY